MRVVSGLFDHMVMQRNLNGFCEQKICGEALANRQITVVLPNNE